MTKMNNDEMTIQPVQPNNLFVTETPEGNIFDLYLVGEIGHPEQYTEVCHALRVAEANDLFLIHINSEGGQVRTGLMLVNAIKESQCQVVGIIEHLCFSMATGVLLACDSFQVNPYSELMIHTSSNFVGGKEHDLFSSVEFSRRQIHKQIRETYKCFLTEEEIEDVIRGTDLYFNAEEINSRLETYSEYRAELAKEAEGDAGGPQDLTEIVSEAVEKILVKYGVIQSETKSISLRDHTHYPVDGDVTEAPEETIDLPEGVEEKLWDLSGDAVKVGDHEWKITETSVDLDEQIRKASEELEALLDQQQVKELQESVSSSPKEPSFEELEAKREKAASYIREHFHEKSQE